MEAKPDTDKSGKVLKDSTVISRMSNLFNTEELSDMTLVVGDRNYKAHRFVLALSSGVFKTMLYGEHWAESAGKDVILKETPECEAVFDNFIKYLYTAEVSINVETAVGILALADKYDVTSLKDPCISYLIETSPLVQIETALSWYTLAKTMNLETLLSACFDAITLDIKSLIKSTMWVDLDIDFLEEILSSSELVIDQEYDLFVGLSQWLLEESRVKSLKENSKRLLPLIRFSHFRGKELLEVEKSKLATDRSSAKVLEVLVVRGYRFRAVCPTHYLPEFSSDVYTPHAFYIPRDYLTFSVINRGPGFQSSFTDKGCYIKKVPGKTKVTVESNMGPVMFEDFRTGIWQISSECVDNSVWKVILYAKDLLGKVVNLQFVLLVLDIRGKVIQRWRSRIEKKERGDNLTMMKTLSYPEKAFYFVILIKPMLIE